MPGDVIPFPVSTPGRYETPRAVKFDCLTGGFPEEPIKLHFALNTGVELVIPIENEIVYDLRTALQAINPPDQPE